MAQRSRSRSQPTEAAHRRMRPETSAWFMLVAFFLVFCAIVALLGVVGWRYYSSAMVSIDRLQTGGLARVHVKTGVNFRAKGSSAFVAPDKLCTDNGAEGGDFCVDLKEGYQIRAVPEAGYGPVASVVLPDQSQIDMWAHPTGADLTLDRYWVSQWTDQRQEVVIQQPSGYARYDITNNQPYKDVSYTVLVNSDVSVALAAGGSYSINVIGIDPERPPVLAESGVPMLVEVAVRLGSATIRNQRTQTTSVAHNDQKIQVDIAGTATGVIAARWQLIRDGNFERFARAGANNSTTAWERRWVDTARDLTPAEKVGSFMIINGCRPETPDFCTPADQTHIGQFRREGNQQKSFAIGAFQKLDADVSEYRSLRFSAWVRVNWQSVPKAGISGSECPVTIQFIYKQRSPADNQQFRYICVYHDDSAAGIERRESEFIYRPVRQFTWYRLAYELRDIDSLESAYYLDTIYIYANGHDYTSEITDISLIGDQ